jgi:hypothetical protein
MTVNTKVGVICMKIMYLPPETIPTNFKPLKPFFSTDSIVPFIYLIIFTKSLVELFFSAQDLASWETVK